MGTQSSFDDLGSASPQPDVPFQQQALSKEAAPLDSLGVSQSSVLERSVTIRGTGVRSINVPFDAEAEADRRANLIYNRNLEPGSSTEFV